MIMFDAILCDGLKKRPVFQGIKTISKSETMNVISVEEETRISGD